MSFRALARSLRTLVTSAMMRRRSSSFTRFHRWVRPLTGKGINVRVFRSFQKVNDLFPTVKGGTLYRPFFWCTKYDFRFVHVGANREDSRVRKEGRRKSGAALVIRIFSSIVVVVFSSVPFNPDDDEGKSSGTPKYEAPTALRAPGSPRRHGDHPPAEHLPREPAKLYARQAAHRGASAGVERGRLRRNAPRGRRGGARRRNCRAAPSRWNTQDPRAPGSGTRGRTYGFCGDSIRRPRIGARSPQN